MHKSGVTFIEYRVYRHLQSVLDDLRNGLSESQRERLDVRFTPTGQFLVSWRGLSDSTRKTVLLAHVDREGFLVRRLDESARTALCWHTAAEMPDEDKIGSPVKLLCSDCTLKGHIEKVPENKHPLSAAEPFDHEVLVRIDRKEEIANLDLIENEYFVGIGHYDIPPWSYEAGMISATHVDNIAGVSVVLSVMTAIVRNSWRVNVDFLFTTCEEAGFCGVSCRDPGWLRLNAARDGDIVCVVVDSSGHTAFLKEQRLWDPEPMMESDKKQASDIPLQSPVIRTGDKYTLYDYEVARLLCAAATNPQGVVGKPDRAFWVGRSRKCLSEGFRSNLKTEQTADRTERGRASE